MKGDDNELSTYISIAYLNEEVNSFDVQVERFIKCIFRCIFKRRISVKLPCVTDKDIDPAVFLHDFCNELLDG